MSATLTTRLNVPTLGDDIEVEIDYTYLPRHQELIIDGAAAIIPTGAGKRELPVWHLLTQAQRRRVEEDCRVNYIDRMDQAVVDRAEGRRDG